jgi:hypothetical protein
MPKRRSPTQMPARIAAVKEKEARALEMVKAGATLAVIASALGYANPSGAWKAIQRGLAAIPKAEADELRLIQSERLADLYRHTLGVLARHHPVLYKGRPVLGADGQALDDDGVKLKAIDTLVRVGDSFARLNGLDLPRKVEVSGVDGEPIAHEVRVGALIERLAAIPAQAVEQPALEAGDGDDG